MSLLPEISKVTKRPKNIIMLAERETGWCRNELKPHSSSQGARRWREKHII